MRTGHALIDRVILRCRQLGSGLVILVTVVIPEPVLAGLKAADHVMPRGLRVHGRVLRRRCVAAADVPAQRTPAEVKPPASGRLAFRAPGPAGRDGRVDVVTHRHLTPPGVVASRTDCRLIRLPPAAVPPRRAGRPHPDPPPARPWPAAVLALSESAS